LRQGVAVEPRVPVQKGTCYEMVVRSSADLESIALFVGWDSTDLQTSLSRPETHWMAHTSGQRVARLHHCVDTTPFGVDLLQFRIEAGRGSGYVSARVYSYPRDDSPRPRPSPPPT